MKLIEYMKNLEKINKTIDYYNSNADWYFRNTVNVDMSECCDRFLKYVVPGGKIIDIGAGSGRDINYFKDRGYVVEGIDASEGMCQLATIYSGIDVICERIQDWHPQGKYDGIWANASLQHLELSEIEEFIIRALGYLNINGALYISVKKGMQTGCDEKGRFFVGLSEEKVQQMVTQGEVLVDFDIWITEDALGRNGENWLNMIMVRKFLE